VILGSSASGGRVTMVGNLFAHIVERNPLTRARELVFVNNLVYDRGTMDVDLQTEYSRITKSSLAGNVFLKGPSYDRTTKPIYMRTTGSAALVSGARVYANDNYAPDTGSTIAQIASYTGGEVVPDLLSTTTAPVWNTGLTARGTANNAVFDRVLKFAGARPTDRDTVDKRVVQSVKDRSGQIINCVASNGSTRCSKNGGGWPSIAQHTRTLTIPSSPTSTASNGYTNLENWLHAMDETLAGIVQAQSPTSPPALSVQ
jgi:hypothetical protein